MRRLGAPVLSVALAAAFAPAALAEPHDVLIVKHAAANSVPEALVRRIIRIESRGNARAVSKGNYGLMQIRLGTARALGYSGSAEGLLDPETNLTYAVKYLAGAYRAAGCNIERAVSYYQRGYYGARRLECRTMDAPGLSGPNDGLKPRLVHTETISTTGVAPARVRPSGPFEPMRILPQDAASPPAPELAAMPMPPNRPEFESAKPAGKATGHARHGRRAKRDLAAKTGPSVAVNAPEPPAAAPDVEAAPAEAPPRMQPESPTLMSF